MTKKKEAKTRLFENDLTITGKHATYLKFLVNDAKIFKDYIDVYMNAAVLGFIYGKHEERDSDSSDRARIYADAFVSHRNDCIFIYRLIILLEDRDMSIDERLDCAFRLDANPDKEAELQANLDVFNSYVRGGIEYMYSIFTEHCTSRDDYIRTTYEVIRDFKDSIDGVSYEEKIKALLQQ